MGNHWPIAALAKKILRGSQFTQKQAVPIAMCVPKGYLAFYVGETQKWTYVVPISHLTRSSIQDIISQAEEKFGFNYPMGGLRVPCEEEVIRDLTILHEQMVRYTKKTD